MPSVAFSVLVVAEPFDLRMSEKDFQFMRRAIELSSIGAQSGGRPFGAVVVKDGKMVGEGHNTVTLSHDPTAHGEVVAIREACKNLKTWNLTGCELYTSCEPCAMCTSVIWLAKIDKVYYANKLADTLQYFDMRLQFTDVNAPAEKRSTPYQQLCGSEAFEVIKKFAEKGPNGEPGVF